MPQVYATEKNITNLAGAKIVVDLTPMLPGGENGGAKHMTLELLHALARLLPETEFLLFTAESSHSELDGLEERYANISRRCVLRNSPQIDNPASVLPSAPTWKAKVLYRLKLLADPFLSTELKQRIKELPLLFSALLSSLKEQVILLLKAVLPLRLRRRIKRMFGVAEAELGSKSVIHQLGANLLFCPFTAPFYADPRIPTVSVIYDLQYRAYPQFFTSQEAVERENNFRIACQKANYLTAISEFVRQTVIEAAKLPPRRVTAIPIGLLRDSQHTSSDESTNNARLRKYGLHSGKYIFYPANFWQHKNHAMLLTAFSMYRHASPGSALKLLCTGAPGPGAEAFCTAVRQMGLQDWVVYAGYVAAEEYDFLLKSSFAMVFPSLYEGFGIPVLEAMALGVPVLCSEVTSLPEVGGDAALYFDPRKPAEIIAAWTRLSEEPGLRERLIREGLHRVQLFAGADRMAIQYADVFAKSLFADK